MSNNLHIVDNSSKTATVKQYLTECRVDFKSGIFVESKSGKDFSLSAHVFTLCEPLDCC